MTFWTIVFLAFLLTSKALEYKGKKYAFHISFFIVNLLWFPLAYRTYQRVDFIKIHNGFEGENGRGSPLAFLMNFILEQSVFIPMSILFILGLMVIFKGLINLHFRQNQRNS
jgi:hypothetical protein